MKTTKLLQKSNLSVKTTKLSKISLFWSHFYSFKELFKWPLKNGDCLWLMGLQVKTSFGEFEGKKPTSLF